MDGEKDSDRLFRVHDSCKMQSTALKIVGDRDRHEAFPDQVFLKIVLTGDNSYN